MEAGQRVSFSDLMKQGYILYDINEAYELWGNDSLWVYVTCGVITNVVQKEARDDCT